jgi:hypothetical protein BACCOPRO_00195
MDQFVLEKPSERPLIKRNFMWMIIAGVMIVAGFLLMFGGSSTTEEFNPDIFSARRIVVGPTMAFCGYVVMAIALILKPRVATTAAQSNGEEVDL